MGRWQAWWSASWPPSASPAADTTALEREIDERVYRRYALTAGEIKRVKKAGP